MTCFLHFFAVLRSFLLSAQSLFFLLQMLLLQVKKGGGSERGKEGG